MAHTLRVQLSLNPVQKSLFVQEKIAGQYSLKVQLLKKVAGGHGHLTKRILQIAGLSVRESLACFGELLFIQEIESSAKLRNGYESRRFAARSIHGLHPGRAHRL